MTTAWNLSTSRFWNGVLCGTSRRLGADPPYRKNDNCFAEQKNYDAVRKTAGYFRFDSPAEQEAPVEVYTDLCPPYNYRDPSFKPFGFEKPVPFRLD
jgi:hypothetical protein